jgi:glucose-1-phosphate thymidylyltransferase
MLPAGNRPILEHVLDALIDAGVTDVRLVVGYRRDRVQDHFGATYRGCALRYHIQEPRLGTGDALRQVADEVDGRFVVVNGDEPLTGGAVEAVADARDTATALAVVESERAPQYGAVRRRGDRVTELVERPRSDDYRLLNAGVYAFDDRIFDVLADTPRTGGELSLVDAVSTLVDGTDPVRAVTVDGPWVDATYPWDLLDVAGHVLAEGAVTEPERGFGSESESESESEFAPGSGIYVAETARVDEDAVVRPPAVVGPDVEVGPGVVLGPEVALGRNVTLGANATILRSVLDEDTRVGPNATLVDCVTGQNARVGAGATVPGGPGDVRVGTTIHEDRRLGAVLADRATLAGNASTAPGTLVGPNARVSGGVHARGVVDEGAEVTR